MPAVLSTSVPPTSGDTSCVECPCLDNAVRETLAECLSEHLELELLPRIRELLRAELHRGPLNHPQDGLPLAPAQEGTPDGVVAALQLSNQSNNQRYSIKSGSGKSALMQMSSASSMSWGNSQSGVSQYQRPPSSPPARQSVASRRTISLLSTSTGESSSEKSARMQAIMTKQRETVHDRCMLHPHGCWRLLWDTCAMLALVADTFYLLFEAAFLQGSSGKELPTFVASLMLIIECFWWIDIVLNFRTGFFDTASSSVQMKGRVSACRYLRSWFMIDFASTVNPLIGRIWAGDTASKDGHGGVFRFIKMLKMTKLLRLSKLKVLNDLLLRLEMTSRSPMVIAIVSFLQLSVMMLAISHCFACILWRMNCIDKTSGVEHASLFQEYSVSMHLSMSVMTGMGVGVEWPDAAMVSAQCVLIAYYFVALIILGIITHEVVRIHARINSHRSATTELISQAAQFMHWYAVPYGLQLNVQPHLRRLCEYKNIIDFGKNLREWLKRSSGVLSELNSAVYGRCIESHPQLQRMPHDLQMFVCNLCDVAFFEPGEIVVRTGRSPTHLLFVRQGMIDFQRTSLRGSGGSNSLSALRGSQRASIASGDSLQDAMTVGEGTLLFGDQLFVPERDTIQHVGVSVSFCELIVLEFNKFHMEMRRCHPEMLTMLCITAATEADSPALLAWAMKSSNARTCNDRLPDGEIALHKCILAQAFCCLRWLVCEERANVNAVDINGKTAVFNALQVQNKEVLDLLILNGAQVDAHESAFSQAIELGVGHHGSESEKPRIWRFRRSNNMVADTESPEEECSISLCRSFEPTTVDELRARLEEDGFNCNERSADGSCAVMKLFTEVKDGYCMLNVAPNGKLLRTVELVGISASLELDDGTVRILHQVEDEQRIAAGSAVRLPWKKACDNLEEELKVLWNRVGADEEFVAEHFTRGPEKIWQKMGTSREYFGQRSLYQFHMIKYTVSKSPCETNGRLGLPSGKAFSTSSVEGDGCMRTRIFTWCNASGTS